MASAASQKAEKSAFIVFIKDLSGADNEGEVVGGFETDSQAIAFARAYLCDSVERCRMPGAFGNEVLKSWQLFGEDVEVKKGDKVVWHSAEDLAQFIKVKAQAHESNWRDLDPRKHIKGLSPEESAFGIAETEQCGCDHHPHDGDEADVHF